jgi:hypothetical protein
MRTGWIPTGEPPAPAFHPPTTNSRSPSMPRLAIAAAIAVLLSVSVTSGSFARPGHACHHAICLYPKAPPACAATFTCRPR